MTEMWSLSFVLAKMADALHEVDPAAERVFARFGRRRVLVGAFLLVAVVAFWSIALAAVLLLLPWLVEIATEVFVCWLSSYRTPPAFKDQPAFKQVMLVSLFGLCTGGIGHFLYPIVLEFGA